jgi:hypothetical protein
MADMDISGPAWNALREVRRNADEAERRGKLSHEKWKALLEEGMVAAQGNPDLLDFIRIDSSKNACPCAGDSRPGSRCGGAAASCDEIVQNQLA